MKLGHEAEQVMRQFIYDYLIRQDLEAALSHLREPFVWIPTGAAEVFRTAQDARVSLALQTRSRGYVFHIQQADYETTLPAPGVASVFIRLTIQVTLPSAPPHMSFCCITAQLLEGPDGWKIHLLHGSTQESGQEDILQPSQQQLEEAQLRDSLTGIWGMEGIVRRAKELIYEYPDQKYVVLKFGIKNFRYINQSYGFSVGDKILRSIARNLQRACGDREVCGRVEKDIFAAVLEFHGKSEILDRLNHLCCRLVDQDLLDLFPMDIFFSGGLYLPDDARHEEIKDMLDKALIAMQSVQGRVMSNRFAFFDPDMAARQFQDSRLLERSQAAMEQEEFKVFIQPQVDSRTGVVRSGEALVRWIGPDGIQIQPNSFIPLYEQSRFILQFDFYMLDQLCRLLRSWLDQGLTPVPVSINQSRLHLADPGYFQSFCQIVDRWNIPHRLIIFELTESAFIEDNKRMLDLARNLHRSRFLLAIDDFGTGFSSLNLLSLISADILKLDKSLVDDAGSKRGQIILRKVVEMARESHISVVCEGVETEEQARLMSELDCDLCQGFYFYRPMPAADFARRFLGQNPEGGKKGS